MSDQLSTFHIKQVEAEMQEQTNSKIEGALLKHGKLFILHFVFLKIPSNFFSDDTSEKDFGVYQTTQLEDLVKNIMKLAEEYLTKNYDSGKLWHLFRSIKKLREFQSFILKNS